MTNLPKIPDLAEVTTQEDLEKLREHLDVLEALRVCHKKAKTGLKKLNEVAEAKIRAEREGGRYLKEVPREGRGEYQRDQRGPSSLTDYQRVLKEAGIPSTTAKRWQLIASIPEPTLLGEIARLNERQREVSSAYMIRLAKKLKDDGTNKPKREIPCGKCPCCKAWAKRLEEARHA